MIKRVTIRIPIGDAVVRTPSTAALWGVTPMWKACDAPAGSCGAGPRKGYLTADDSCRTCGSQLRVLKNQNRRAS